MPEPIEMVNNGVSRVGLDPRELRTHRPLAPPEGKSFKEVLTDAIGEVQRLQTEADTTIRQLVAGEIKDVTQAMVAVEKADIAFQTMMAVRNRVVAAYEEIMRMQI
ncbi:MAG: flagellar hook-basal body complex protein FliE [Candidatus Hydrogenedentes bacterium]|nr:flagellar hook-basal body complex protein FliE [Candidatus Hydrogenedentota bacterium]